MNKLLQHIINAGDVDHKVLPGLQKMQKAGTVTSKQPVDPRVFPKETLENRQKVYRTVRPTDYTDIKNYARYFFNNDRDEWDDARSEEAFKMYLGLEPKPQYFRPSKYKPTINATPNEYYYSADEQLEQDIFNSFKDRVRPGQILPTDEYFVDSKFPGNPNAFWEGDKQMVKLDYNDDNLIFGRPMASRARALGQFVVSRGSDEQGDYLSYADQYDFPEKLQNKMQGKPYKIYGRIYYPKPKKAYGGIFAQEGLEYKGPSIVDYLATKGYSGNKEFRKGLAEKYGIEGYNFSAAKNTELLNRLRENDDLLEQNYQPTQAAIPVERMMEMENQARAARQAAAQSAAPPPAQRPVNPGNYYTYSPDYGDMRITPPKINTSLQPKVKYDKFSLTPQMVIPLPFGFGKQTTSEIPNSEIIDPVRPRVSIPQFNPFGKPAVKPILGPLTSNISEQEVDPINEESRQEAIPGIGKPMGNKFMFNNQDLYSFYKPQGKNLLPYVPANKPTVKTQKYTPESESETPWYEEAVGKVSNFFSDAYDSFAESVNKSPLDFKGMNFGSAGISPQGANAMTRDLTENILSFVSPDFAEKYKNWYTRQNAIKNMDKDPKSSIIVPKYDFAPMYVTGDTIPDAGNRQYHIPESMDVDALRFGVRNRGDNTPIDTEAASITAFHPFVNAKTYFADAKDDPANATYLAYSPDGRIQVGERKDFENKDVQVSRVFSNKVVDFVREPSGSIKKVPAGAKVNKNAFSPAVTVLDDQGKQVQGKLNLVVPQGNKADEAFGIATGGRFIFKTPDGQTRLVSGSLKNIEEEFKRIKGKNPYVTVVSLDNGSYSRGLRTFDKKLTAEDLNSYDNLNHGGGGNFAYLLPGQETSRPLAKFKEFENEATKKLQALYPGKKVSVGFQNTGLYDQTGGRDIQSQVEIQKKGNSQTSVSLHNFGAAKDYVLYVDGKAIDADKDKKIYKDVLWSAADKTGMYHLEDWDPAHISLAKEGQKTAFDELKSKYPEIFTNPNFVKSLEYINKNKSNPLYQEYYELLNNIQPFTGQPRITEFSKRSTVKKQRGGETDSTLENILEVFDPTGISSWDDVYRSANDPNSKWYDTAVEVAGALPLVGKLGKLTKAGIHLKKYKGLDKLLYNALPKSGNLSKTLQGAAMLGRGTDAVQAGMQAPSAPFFPSAPPAEVGQFGVYAGMQKYKKQGGPILDPRGQWAHPGKVTRIPGSDITMQGVNYPVLGIGNNGKKQIMYPGQEYNFGGASYVDEYPMMQKGGQRIPIAVSDPKDSRLLAYNDSLARYNSTRNIQSFINKYEQGSGNLDQMQKQLGTLEKHNKEILSNKAKSKVKYNVPFGGGSPFLEGSYNLFEKPLQPIQYKKTEELNPIQFTPKGSKKYIVNGTEVSKEDFLRLGPINGGSKRVIYNTPKIELQKVLRLDGTSETDPEKILRALGIANNREQFQNGGLLSRSVSCSNCGWSWKVADGGSDPMTCHKCGGTVKMKNGGQHGGLDRWFAEKWVDVKTGKACGRQEGESRAGYPACRPSKRVNSQTPKTSSEMSSAEKAKFKASKTSSQRIDYNHKRNK